MTGVIERLPRNFPRARPGGHDSSLVERLAAFFSEQLSAPVAILDPAELRWCARSEPRDVPLPDPAQCVREAIANEPLDGPCTWSTEPESPVVWLILPLGSDAPGALYAVAGFLRIGSTAPEAWGPPCPEPALLAWGRAVLDPGIESRAFLPGVSSAEVSRGLPLTERLLRRLRVSDPPERFQRVALQAVCDDLGASAAAWVPASQREPIIAVGSVPGLVPESYRGLTLASSTDSLSLLDHPAPEGTRKAAVVTADRETASGWLVAIGAPGGREFSSADLEVLRAVAPLLAAQRSNARLYGDLKELLFGIIRALTSAIDAKDPYTSGHSERVARIAVRLGEQIGLTANQRGDLYLMGLLHDVGKIGIEDTVLKKPSKLDSEEYRQIQAHVRIGVHILSDLKKLSHLMPGIAHHHESLDGTGYPAGLAGSAIPLAARILAVADAFDAMSSDRPYRRRLAPQQIDQIFEKGVGKQWDPQIVAALFACRQEIERIRSKGIGDSLHRAVGDTLGRQSEVA